MRAFQRAVARWMDLCFGEGPATSQNGKDSMTRAGRFFEEACEMTQANGITYNEALKQLDYTYRRPVGVPSQEMGGCLVTLAALAESLALNMEGCANAELMRISEPGMIERIRAKQATKPSFTGILPGAGYKVGDAHDDCECTCHNDPLYAHTCRQCDCWAHKGAPKL